MRRLSKSWWLKKDMKKTVVLLLLLQKCALLRGVTEFDKVPIGAVFDNKSVQVVTAFRHEVQSFNRAFAHNFKFQLEPNITVLDVTDSFAVSNALCGHLAAGVYAIFGVSNASSLATIQSYTNTFRTPFITISMAQNMSSPDAFQIYMRPLYVKALIDVIEFYEWAMAYYIYDSDEGLIRLQQLFQSINKFEYDLHINAKRTVGGSRGSAKDCFRILHELHHRDVEKDIHVILDVEMDTAEAVILMLYNDQDMNNAKFHFLLAELGVLEMNHSNFRIGGMNMTGFQLMDPENETAKTVLNYWQGLDPRDWPGAGTRNMKYEAALVVDSVKLFTRTMRAILSSNRNFLQGKGRGAGEGKGIKCTDDSLIKAGQGTEVIRTMKKVEFEGVTGRVAFDSTGQRKHFRLDVYEVGINRGTAKVGYWNEETALTIEQPRLWKDPSITTSHNRTRIVTTIAGAPYVTYKKIPKDGQPLVNKENLEGFCIDLANAVAEKLQFDFVIRFVRDGNYGAKQPNGTWNGMVGELIRQEADMAIAPLTITAARERVIDFTKPFMSLGISIMIKKPQNQKAHVFSFMDPLSYEIWMCIVFAYIGVSVVLFLVSRFSPNEWHISDDSSIANDFTISNSLWFSLGAFMQQGCDISPRSMSGRIVGSVWWFFTLIIISSYTANLAAFLTVERMLTPVESAEDLAKQTDIQYGTVDSGSSKAFFKNSRVGIYQRMWSYMTSAQPTVFMRNITAGIERVRSSNGKYAFLIESTTNDYYNQRKPCDTMKVGNNLNSNGFGIATPIGSDIKDSLNFAVLELRESGKLAQWQKHWWFDKGECPKESKSKDGPSAALTLQNVAGIFYILIGGLIIALVSAAGEFFYKSKVDSKLNKTTFGSALRSKARLSFRGHLDSREEGTSRKAMATVSRSRQNYTYSGPTQVGMDAYADTNTHTQV